MFSMLMKTWRIQLLCVLGVLGAVAIAGDLDARGWSEGQVAAGFAKAVGPMPDDAVIELPEDFAQLLKKPTLIVYFSPTCPHCTAVTPELVQLAKRVGKKADVILVATTHSSEEEIDAYRSEYEVKSLIWHDKEQAISMAMGARSTPTALLVRRNKKTKVIQVEGAWYPYSPGSDTLAEIRMTGDVWGAFRTDEYLGNNACAGCHQQEMDAWLLSHHSVAWATLARKGNHENAECVTCHVTGSGQEGGWDGDSHGPLVNVGCESCHGPAGPHDGKVTVPESTCEGCHDKDHSIAFTYEKGLPLIDHFKAQGMSQADWMAQRQAYFDGEMPQELLAFPEGKTQGPDACISCHEAQHTQWKNSPHATAMATLHKPDDEDHTGDVACVSCHATQKEYRTLPASELDEFATDVGGVGCESCHGPAEAHIAAGGGKGNIQGLGASCPVCVLESICTTCHTSKMDPGWELEKRLESVKH